MIVVEILMSVILVQKGMGRLRIINVNYVIVYLIISRKMYVSYAVWLYRGVKNVRMEIYAINARVIIS